MGLWFSKTISLLPGLRLNVDQNGISSVGIGNGRLGMNLNQHGAVVYVRLGNGLTYNKAINFPITRQPPPTPPQNPPAQ